MTKLYGCLVVVTLVASATFARAADAQYPTRPIRLIVPSAAGGLPDIQARLLSSELSKQLGQQVVVENRPGASGVIGFEATARSTPDGYTFGYASFPICTNPAMFAKLPYDALRDFRMVVQQVSALNIVTVTPALPIRSIQDLVDYARANPGKLSFASPGHGSSQHLSIELLKVMTNTNLVHVPYKAIQQAITEQMTGQMHVVADNMGSILPHVKANRVRGLAVTSPKRSPAMPDLPAVAETIPGFEIMPWSGYVVPRRTPDDVVRKLNAEINKALFSPAVSEKLIAIGSTPVGGTPEQFEAHMRSEMAKWAKVLRAAGIKPE
jgi:tripartite-type tricarboxylate transporter receptor subunit TctC